MDNSTLLYLLGLVFAFWLGNRFARAKFLYNISENPERTIETLKKIQELNRQERLADESGAPAEAILVQKEEQQGLVYLFNKETDQFLGQGKTIEDALKQASSRFPNKIFWLPKSQADTQTTCNT